MTKPLRRLNPKVYPRKVSNFDSLVSAIVGVHEQLQFQAAKAVNVSLTIRNWMFGCYIREYEQRGKDRAAYGQALLAKLAARLQKQNIPATDARELRRYRRFYLTYPQIRGTLSPKLTDEPFSIRETVSPELGFSGVLPLQRLSFSHFTELLDIGDQLKRTFYEEECLRGNWSVRELKRQIVSLYYERSGLSKNKEKISQITQATAEPALASQIIRDPYVFEFLGLKSKDVMGESSLEDSLLDKLQDFMLELGRGFCFEARQKRVLIGGEHYFVDLVFYHRILKCHVLIELKADEFSHQYLGQLNTYVNWYREHESVKGDNPPIGLLLCTRKNRALVKYAMTGISNRLFVSKYRLELPKKEEICRFLEEHVAKKLQ